MGERSTEPVGVSDADLEASRTIVDHAGQPLFLVDVVHEGGGPRFEIDRFNPAYEDQTGLSLEDARGLTPREWLGDDVGAALEERYRECLEKRERLRYEEELALPGGTETWETTLTPVLVDGEVSRIVGTTRDVTDRRRAQRERTRSRDLLRHAETLANTGGWELDVRTDEVRWTRGTRRIFGVPASAELTLERALSFYHPDDRSAVRDALERCRTAGEPYDLESRITRADGADRWIRSRGEAVLEDGRIVTLRGAIQDVTDRRAQERELERQNERLAEFSSVVSHDLRNPLTVAQGRLSLALTEADVDEDAREHLAEVETALDRIDTIVDDALALARNGRSVTEPEWVDLEAATEGAWQMVDTADAALALDARGRVRADTCRLRRLCENLFRNSVEHGDDGVTVRVGTLEGGDGLFVEDDGPGIPPDEREDVFEPGYTTNGGGTGLGLTIVRRIADAHGWSVRATEEGNGGARFELTGVDLDAEQGTSR